jgi:hypothetical protein
MTAHYRLGNSTPSAIITRKHSEMKIYQENTLFLNDGDNFEFRLFNPLSETIGVEILLNGIKTEDAKLVLRPGEDVTLERYLSDNKKFKFETYSVDANNPAVQSAIRNNGDIQINFYKEKVTPQNYYFGCRGTVCGTSYSTTTTSNDTFVGSTASGYRSYDANVKSLDSSSHKLSRRTKSKETGRVGKGGNSNQQISNINIEFESFSFFNICYKLLPASEMNINIREVRQYCTQCGFRLRKENWQYCPKCGNKI